MQSKHYRLMYSNTSSSSLGREGTSGSLKISPFHVKIWFYLFKTTIDARVVILLAVLILIFSSGSPEELVCRGFETKVS